MTYIYTKDELMTVVRWLEDHHKNSESQRLITIIKYVEGSQLSYV
jgi:hypothetical protein